MNQSYELNGRDTANFWKLLHLKDHEHLPAKVSIIFVHSVRLSGLFLQRLVDFRIALSYFPLFYICEASCIDLESHEISSESWVMRIWFSLCIWWQRGSIVRCPAPTLESGYAVLIMDLGSIPRACDLVSNLFSYVSGVWSLCMWLYVLHSYVKRQGEAWRQIFSPGSSHDVKGQGCFEINGQERP